MTTLPKYKHIFGDLDDKDNQLYIGIDKEAQQVIITLNGKLILQDHFCRCRDRFKPEFNFKFNNFHEMVESIWDYVRLARKENTLTITKDKNWLYQQVA